MRTITPKNLNFQNVSYTENVVFSSASSVSPAVTLGGMQLRGLYLPSNFTPCDLTFQVSGDGVHFYNLLGLDGTYLTITISTPGFLPLLPYLFDAFSYVQITSSTSQVSSPIIGFSMMPLYQGIHN